MSGAARRASARGWDFEVGADVCVSVLESFDFSLVR